MFTSQVIRRCLIPAAAVVVEATVKPQAKNEQELLCRPSELPIYSPEPIWESTTALKEREIPGFIEDSFRNIRLTLTKYNEELQAYKKVGLDQFEKSRENVEYVISYLQEENNTLPKAGAIGIGALTGLIFGLRGGFFKRTLYATTGALGMAALCYPKEAAVYTRIGLTESKKYITIAYNFVYGVKKDDPPLELPSLPKIPTSFSEAWESVKSTATSFVSDEKKPELLSTEKVPKSN
ncbi:MICOS complex subunit MIC27 [Anoplophora glabripennis]|uniref:MICOS complex subunit MIC27 n=1 Tax=Anoplophora glabripennis TaxID=217634 RepID=UPI00087580AE|nr:MICOS complex subunit MIC27 [Anoplophora glabripennis]